MVGLFPHNERMSHYFLGESVRVQASVAMVTARLSLWKEGQHGRGGPCVTGVWPSFGLLLLQRESPGAVLFLPPLPSGHSDLGLARDDGHHMQQKV